MLYTRGLKKVSILVNIVVVMPIIFLVLQVLVAAVVQMAKASMSQLSEFLWI